MPNTSRIKFDSLNFNGTFALSLEVVSDLRGSLVRIWEDNSVQNNFDLKEASLVNNPLPGTLRGLHYQSSPFMENKIIICLGGTVFDVILDLRMNSSTYGQHVGIEIGPNRKYQGVFVPAGCAHGYITLESNSTLIYFMDKLFSPKSVKGIRWDDKKLQIKWPMYPQIISKQDLNWPELNL